MNIIREFDRIRASVKKDKWVEIECPACGTPCEMLLGNARKGRGCGCLGGKKTHGLARTPIYNTWHMMLQRCNNPNHKFYLNYGGRGVTVIDRWNTFANFYEDMGPRPKGTTLDRIDNNGNYEYANCRWATTRQQVNNRINTKFIDGVPLADVARTYAICPRVLWQRLDRGWTIERALTTKVR